MAVFDSRNDQTLAGMQDVVAADGNETIMALIRTFMRDAMAREDIVAQQDRIVGQFAQVGYNYIIELLEARGLTHRCPDRDPIEP